MNPAAILSLIADMYTQIGQLRADNEELRKQLAAKDGPLPKPGAMA